MSSGTAAYVGHITPGRLRLKVPSRRNDEAYFKEARQILLRAPGVLDVEANPLTGSFLIHHGGTEEEIARSGQENGLFQIRELRPQPPPLGSQIKERLAGLNRNMSGILGREVDIWEILFVSLVGLAIVQIFRGRILVPAVTLLWYAGGAAFYARMRGLSSQLKLPGM